MFRQMCEILVDEREQQLDRHGTAAFSAAFYRGEALKFPVAWHWHDELEIILAERGGMALGIAGGREVLREGEGCFINGGVLHSVRSLDGTEAVYRSAVFHPRVIGGRDSIFWEKYVLPLREPDFPAFVRLRAGDDAVSEILGSFEGAWEAGIGEREDAENEARYLLTKVLSGLVRRPREQGRVIAGRTLRDMERMKTMLAFLEAHYAEPLTVEAIAASASLSGSECLRCFQRNVGISPVRYLGKYRLQRAAELLSGTGRSIQEIASACGYEDVSYFSRAFRSEWGMPPRTYRTQGLSADRG